MRTSLTSSFRPFKVHVWIRSGIHGLGIHDNAVGRAHRRPERFLEHQRLTWILKVVCACRCSVVVESAVYTNGVVVVRELYG